MPGACVWKKVLGRVSLHIGAPLGEGGHLPGTLRITGKGVLALEHLTLWELC